MISCSQAAPVGGLATLRQNCGSTKDGIGAATFVEVSPPVAALRAFVEAFSASFAFGDGVAVRAGFGCARPSLARSSSAWPVVESQTASGAGALPSRSMKGVGALPLPAAIVRIARPDATERSIVRTPPPSSPSLASASRCLMSSQLVRFPAKLVGLHAHQHEAALQPLAVERELELAARQRLAGLAVLGRPGAAVEQLYRAAAVLVRGYRALEVAVAQRMVLDLDGEALVGRGSATAPWSPPTT